MYQLSAVHEAAVRIRQQAVSAPARVHMEPDVVLLRNVANCTQRIVCAQNCAAAGGIDEEWLFAFMLCLFDGFLCSTDTNTPKH